MKKLIIILATIFLICISTSVFVFAKEYAYPDLTWTTKDKFGRIITHVASGEREIAQATAIGILEGYPDGTFKPNNPITRSEFIKSLIVLATNRTFDFNNIDSRYPEWYGPYVTIAEMQGIIDKGQYTKEELDKPITRIEMVLMLAKTQINMKGIEQFQLGKLRFTDIDSLTKDEKALVLHAAQYDLLEGMKEGESTLLEPNKNLTREEAAVAFMRIY